MTILVSIVSEQTVPNYLFIKEFQRQVDKFLFISTEQMEKQEKTDAMCSISGIQKDKRIKVLVSDSYLHEVKERLKKINLPEDANYLVHLTGGTKMMSIAVWRYFQSFKNVRFFYVPIRSNSYVEVFDDKPSLTTPFNYKISVEEHLSIYGIRFESKELMFDENLADDIFEGLKANQFKLNNFPQDILEKHKILSNVQQNYTKWFEEYCYYLIKRELNLNENEILTGVNLYDLKKEKEIKNYQNDNELDVVFIYNNIPYIIECKYSVGKEKVNTLTINQVIYKLSSINKRFGLSARSTIFTLSNFGLMNGNAKENLRRRCEIAGIYYPLFDVTRINSGNFKEYLLSFLK